MVFLITANLLEKWSNNNYLLNIHLLISRETDFFGDCCGYNVNTDLCSDCKCYVNETCVAGTHPLVGDGFCNDETNNENCNYDGGECCSTCTSTSKCAECACLSGTDDTCHSKPISFYYSHFSNGVHTGAF